ncbi:pteridine reductase [Solemya pervernicosa gill symbiont]|uniref:Pteridine reductase n=2 Tax=Gammaproteobacteria incertae sedis TaxID=118884 RepID=A0A1T2L0B6_9GAMM|nr:pteridine reductase [Candidatus Reidiella endopervernicosa]OOZ38522.1 pteridine reductase [Solemya pervernicosa gill symbiont]QKQ24965.1 pteridine reductase [Candidatus Reidiella endopervernicosa]
MSDTTTLHPNQTALITGAAHRIGATTARTLHAHGIDLLLHYRHSTEAAEKLANELNAMRADSVRLLQADLHETGKLPVLIEQAVSAWGRLDILVNNASSFYPTPVGEATTHEWDDLMGSNLKAPFFLSQAAAPHLLQHRGVIINIVDIHAEQPLKGHPIYSMAKAGLVMMTRSLARELGPEIRVNGVAPGAILWPEQGLEESDKSDIIDRTALKRQGQPTDIARAVLFLIREADYMTGQIMTVDGGRSLGY